MTEPAFLLNPRDRNLVLNSIVDACAQRSWRLFCVHIRTNHVHIVLQTDVPIDRALIYLKARATLLLKAYHPDRLRFWTKHGSTRYLWDRTSLAGIWDYVMNRQGTSVALWSADR